MKLLTRCIYAVLFIGFSLNLYATIEPTVSIRGQKGQSFSLHLKDMKNETYTIKLSDPFGFVLINEQVEDQNEYLKFFNLKKLPAGDYIIRIESERKISLQTISISNQKVHVQKSTKKEIFKPSVKFEYPYLNLNMLHFEETGVRMVIKDKKGYVLHEDDIFLTGSITERFRISALPIGMYIFEISTNNYTYEQEFSVSADNKLNLKSLTTGK